MAAVTPAQKRSGLFSTISFITSYGSKNTFSELRRRTRQCYGLKTTIKTILALVERFQRQGRNLTPRFRPNGSYQTTMNTPQRARSSHSELCPSEDRELPFRRRELSSLSASSSFDNNLSSRTGHDHYSYERSDEMKIVKDVDNF
jgi:hypothetical protein